jgi:hypothetical protein
LRCILPFELLVGMRKQVRRSSLSGLILRASEGLNERADVGDERGVIAIEERLDVGKAGMQGEIWRRGERQQRILRQREVASERRVLAIAGGIEGNQRIVGIVSAEEKYANQRFVVAGGLRQSVERAKWAQAKNVAGGGKACAVDEGSTVCPHGESPDGIGPAPTPVSSALLCIATT